MSHQPGHEHIVVHPVAELGQVDVHHDIPPPALPLDARSVRTEIHRSIPRRSGPPSLLALGVSLVVPTGLLVWVSSVVAFHHSACLSLCQVSFAACSSRPATIPPAPLFCSFSQSYGSPKVIPSTPGAPFWASCRAHHLCQVRSSSGGYPLRTLSGVIRTPDGDRQGQGQDRKEETVGKEIRVVQIKEVHQDD